MKIKKSTYLPAILLIYLIFMAYLGLPILKRGDYLYYFFRSRHILACYYHASFHAKTERTSF